MNVNETKNQNAIQSDAVSSNTKGFDYLDSVHRDGRIWNIIVMIVLFLFPVVVGLIFSAVPDWRGHGFPSAVSSVPGSIPYAYRLWQYPEGLAHHRWLQWLAS